MKLLIIGASGKLGSFALAYFRERYDVLGTYHRNRQEQLAALNACDPDAVKRILFSFDPDIVLYAAGQTDVDKCEAHPEEAFAGNASSVKNIMRFTKAKMIYISTDYVFDGASGAYCETAKPNPINTYGKSKLAGENAVLANKNNAVLRVSGLYHPSQNSITKESVCDDNRFSSPVNIADVCRAIEMIIELNLSGIFHASSKAAVSRYEFACVYNIATDSALQILPGLYDFDSPASTARPYNSSMRSLRLHNWGWTESQFASRRKFQVRPLLIADCVGVCLSERAWLRPESDVRAIDHMIRFSNDIMAVIKNAASTLGFTPDYALSRIEKIADYYAPNPYFWNMVRTLKKSFNIVIVNNGLKLVFDVWRRKYRLDEIFDGTINSEEIGIRKPDQALFDLLASRFEVCYRDCVLWDDDPSIVAEADKLGISSALFVRNANGPINIYRPRSLLDLPKTIKNAEGVDGYVES